MQLMKAFAQQQVVGKGQRCVKTKKKRLHFYGLAFPLPPTFTLRLLVDDERNDFPLRLIDDGFKSI